ncbi:MAG: hypothetical protein H0X33_12980 [Taibaiella sp.]|nr:hypothetical protein [Taibaiella sp.]
MIGKKKHSTFIIILLILCGKNDSFSQINYINYHKEVIKAEDLFLQGQINSSLKYYTDIFKRFEKPFAKDCYIALQLACMQNDTNKATFFFKKSFESGINWSSLKFSSYIYTLLKNNFSYSEKISQLYKTGREKYLKNINWSLRDSIINLLKKDWYFKKNHSWTNKTDRYPKYVQALDENIVKLELLSKRYGFPGEHMIGIKDPELDTCDPSFFWRLSSLSSLILFHHRCGYGLMEQELKKALIDGELNPREFALIYEFSYADYKEYVGHYSSNHNNFNYKVNCTFQNDSVKFYDIFIKKLFYCNDSIVVNAFRKEIGMSSLNHDKRKRTFARDNHLILFFGQFDNL